jgi:hypothetical protein
LSDDGLGWSLGIVDEVRRTGIVGTAGFDFVTRILIETFGDFEDDVYSVLSKLLDELGNVEGNVEGNVDVS